MVNALYETLHREALQDPYTGKQSLCFLDIGSFIQKLNQHAQDLQCAFMVTKHFFLPYVTACKDDIAFWMKKIFWDCHTRKDLITFCNNMLLLVPNEGNSDFSKASLADYFDCIKDEVTHLAGAHNIHEQYGDLVETMLHQNFDSRGTNKNQRSCMLRNLVMLRARMRVMASKYLSNEKKASYSSLTKKTVNRKGKKQKMVSFSSNVSHEDKESRQHASPKSNNAPLNANLATIEDLLNFKQDASTEENATSLCNSVSGNIQQQNNKSCNSGDCISTNIDWLDHSTIKERFENSK